MLPRLAWPAHALLAWGAAWGLLLVGRSHGGPMAAWVIAALLVPMFVAFFVNGMMRRAWTVLGFPISAWIAQGAGTMPAWGWLVPLMLLGVLYPARAWRDAPFFPTRRDALRSLGARLSLPAVPRILDAGCGAGDGLLALREAWPQARLDGIEWSPPLAWLTRLRCGFAQVHRGDMWAHDWSTYDLVYVFQRPESMDAAWSKACKEMRNGAWLLSTEFKVPGVAPALSLERPGRRPVHAWCIVHGACAQSSRPGADNPRRPGGLRRGRP